MDDDRKETYFKYQYVPVDGQDRCVCCGAVIPEGGIICPLCASSVEYKQ